MNHFDTESSVFLVKLSQEQKNYVGNILPKGYSLQPSNINNFATKNTHLKKINIQSKEQSVTQKEHEEQKRRKIKSYENLELEQKRNTLGKREQLLRMINIVKKLKKHDSSWPFRAPVDPKALLIPNYTQIVLTPMDLQTIQQRIKANKYDHPGQIQRDINQILLNSYKFNAKDSQYFQTTSKLQQYYNSLLFQNEQSICKKQTNDKTKRRQQNSTSNLQSNTGPKQNQNEKSNQVSQIQKELLILLKRANEVTNETKKKIRQKPQYVSTRNDGPLNIKQRRELVQEIKSLDQVHLCRIYQIIKQISKDSISINNTSGQSEGPVNINSQEKGDIMHIDLQKMDNKMLRQLQNYVRLQKNPTIHDKQQSMIDSQENNYSVF